MYRPSVLDFDDEYRVPVTRVTASSIDVGPSIPCKGNIIEEWQGMAYAPSLIEEIQVVDPISVPVHTSPFSSRVVASPSHSHWYRQVIGVTKSPSFSKGLNE